MNESIRKTCDLIVANRKELKSRMFWEVGSNQYAIMAGMITAANGVSADAEKYKACKKILRRNIDIFSTMRGIVEAVVVTKMTMVQDPEEYVKGVCAVYKKLRSIHKLTASASMVIAAMNIYENKGLEGADENIEKLEKLYKELKKEHPFLIFDEDRAYLSMIVTSGADVAQTVERIEASYEACKKVSFSKDTVHSLAQILALSDTSPELQCEFVKTVVKGLKKEGKPITKGYALPAIGALTLLNMPAEQLVQDIVEADDYLKQNKGFRWFNQSLRTRRIYAILAVFMSYTADKSKMSAMISANLTMTIVEQLILMMVIMATTTSASSAASSSASSS